MSSPLSVGPLGAGAAGAAATGLSTSPAARTGGADLGKDAFLKLLVAQLKYQDPSKPADGTEFLAQTAQFTMVEKLTDLADGQAQLLSAQLMLSAGTMVGKTVAYTGTDGVEHIGVVSAATIMGSSPTVKVGNTDVPLSAVKEIRSNAG
jgi:flagellar basal-body rod modification protein FlgD